jgi:hypothetical protein
VPSTCHRTRRELHGPAASPFRLTAQRPAGGRIENRAVVAPRRRRRRSRPSLWSGTRATTSSVPEPESQLQVGVQADNHHNDHEDQRRDRHWAVAALFGRVSTPPWIGR